MKISKIAKNSISMTKHGFEFASELTGGDVVLLYGDLGVGKTQFSKGIGKYMGISDNIKSPSYTFVWSYLTKHQNITLDHYDLYRLNKNDNLESIGLYEVMGEKNHITVIEWADRLTEPLPVPRYEIRINYIDNIARKLVIEKINQ